MRKITIFILALALILVQISACNLNPESIERDGKIKIVATLFPQYDFAREIVKDKGEVILLLPPGVESHSFEPTPQDIKSIRQAHVFLYTGKYMEPWAEKIINDMGEGAMITVDLSKGIELLEEPYEHGDSHGGKDPHIWLDPVYAQKMVDNIIAAVAEVEPENKDFYEKNGEDYKDRLKGLDRKFSKLFEKTKYKTIIHGGHFAFGYFARRYGLDYISPYTGFSPNAEPSPKKVTELIQNMETLGIDTIFYEELVDPKIARVISEETGAKMLLLHGAHNISKDELKRDISYIDIMEENLEKLKQGLVYNE